MRELYGYQKIGRDFLASQPTALLADEPGLGKTSQAIAAAMLCEPPYVVVCPATVVPVWQAEIKKFDSVENWLVFSYTKAARGDCLLTDIGVLILDEAHFLKNETAARTQSILLAVNSLRARAKRVFALTATPMPNHVGELYPVLRALYPKALDNPKRPGKPLAYWDFVYRYCRVTETPFGLKIGKGKNLDDLRARIAPFILRRTKKQVLPDLPPIRFGELPLSGVPLANLKELERDELVSEFQARLDRCKTDKEREAVMDAVDTKLRQRIGRLTGLSKVEAIVDWVEDQITGGRKKIVLFAHHRDVIDALHKRLGKSAVCITGSTSQADRSYAVWRFQNLDGVTVFIGQITAAGTGITLTAASLLVFVESSWVPGGNEQAAMRIHRIGQNDACEVLFATIPNSIDERIQRAVQQKLETIKGVFG
jgi:SWI/SNF-related matrix-associated actin-dependent regulator 1 of chromatin subfamily A